MGRVGIVGGLECIPSMQVTWHCLTSPTSSHRRLPYKVWRKCRNLIKFWRGTAKGSTKWIVELPDIVCGLVGIGAYTGTASKGGSCHLVCVQLAFRMWLYWMLKVGKVVVKVGPKQPFSAGLMLQDVACLALWEWVQDKSGPRHGQSQCVCFVPWCKVHPSLPHAYQTGHQTPQQKWARPQPFLFRMVKKLALLQHHLLPWHHPLGPTWHHPPPP